jgi:hypothetical protein
MANKCGALVLATFLVGPARVVSSQATDPDTFPTCEVTVPNGITAGHEQPNPNLHGNKELSTYLMPKGTVIFSPTNGGYTTADGALAIKWPWMRGVRGRVKVDGRRLDRVDDRPVRAIIPPVSAYGDLWFAPSDLIFPSPGCWEVTATIDNRRTSKLTFVTRVVKIGDGPARLPDN